MSSGADARRIVSLLSLQQWLIDRCAIGIFYCATRPDPELLCTVVSTGLPVDWLEVGVGRSQRFACPGWKRGVRARSLSTVVAGSALSGPPMDFLLVDDAQVLRLAYDDHDRLVVGFVEFGHAIDRYRLIRDVLWEAASGPRHGDVR